MIHDNTVNVGDVVVYQGDKFLDRKGPFMVVELDLRNHPWCMVAINLGHPERSLVRIVHLDKSVLVTLTR